MANTNTTSNIVQTLFAQGLQALREFSVMPRLVNRTYDPSPGAKGSTIEISIPVAQTASAVTASNTPPDDSGITPTKKTITLDQWYETAFFLNDKELGEIGAGFANDQLTEAARGLANNVDSAILALYKDVYGYGGTAGTTPFASDDSAYRAARAAMARQLAPKNDRFFVMDEDAEANALGLDAVRNASHHGNAANPNLREGSMGRVLGAQWEMDQNVPTHTQPADLVGAINDSTGLAVGTTTLVVDGFSAAVNAGDIITIAGDTQTYVATGTPTTTEIIINPGLKVAIPTADGNEVISVKATHVANLLFQRGAFALAARPLEASDPMGLANGTRRSIMDPVSGLSLTFEVTRQHYRTRFAFSTLYGVQTIRPEFAARVAG